jgi:hypothetical protein
MWAAQVAIQTSDTKSLGTEDTLLDRNNWKVLYINRADFLSLSIP